MEQTAWQFALGFEIIMMRLVAVLALVLAVMALLDLLRQQPARFEAAGTLSKLFWTVLLVVSLLTSLLGVLSPVGGVAILTIAGLCLSSVYLVATRSRLSGGGYGYGGPFGR